METLFIVIPAYNEASNIQQLISDWYPVIEKYHGAGTSRLVVVNDGSTDSTLELLQELEKTHPFLKVLTKQNGGHGSAVLTGYHYAITHGAEFVFQTDSDGQTLPGEFDRFWKLRKKYDAILGSRADRKDGASRVFVENTLCMILRIMFGISVPDANAPYRLMKKELLEKYLPMLPDDYGIPNVMLTTFFAYYEEKLKFLQITFRPRQGGTNSINVRRIMRIGWESLNDFRRFRKEMKNGERP